MPNDEARIRIIAIEEAGKAFKKSIGVFAAIALVLTVLGWFGLDKIVSHAAEDALKKKGADELLITLKEAVSEAEDSADAIQRKRLGLADVPVGSIVAWHKNAIPGQPLPHPPDGWALCDGTPVSVEKNGPLDPDGDGFYAPPNLNSVDGYDGGRFLRGGTPTGTMQDASAIPVLAELGFSNDVYIGNWSTGVHPLYSDVDATIPGNQTGRATINVDSKAETNPGANRPRAARTRPVNMSVVWIMRVK